MPSYFFGRLAVPSLAVALLLAGCGQQSSNDSARGRQASPTAARNTSASGGAVSDQETNDERRAALLNRIRAADPKKSTIERALLNDQNELGLILSRETNLEEVPKLLKAMIVEMDQSFPGQDHVAVAYAPTNPPREIGTARSNARTRDVTYQSAATP